jgi:hypothetical protein
VVLELGHGDLNPTMLRTSAKVAAVTVLLGLYIVTLVRVLRPRVSVEYTAYYVDQVLSDWKPRCYVATPEEGIAFGAPGLPTFVRRMYGFSRRESWGRWTDANHSPQAADGTPVARLVLNEPFQGLVYLNIRGRKAGWTTGRTFSVSFGSEAHVLSFDHAGFLNQCVDFDLSKPADTIEFRPSGIVGSNSMLDTDVADDQQHPHSANTHRRALGIESLQIFRGGCADVKVTPRGTTK